MGIIFCMRCGCINDEYDKVCSGCGKRFKHNPGNPPDNYEEIKKEEFDKLFKAAKTMYERWKAELQNTETPVQAIKEPQKEIGHAMPGDVVIALYDDARAGVDYEIRAGQKYTVHSYDKGAYTFVECPPVYSPYLREEATYWFKASDFGKLSNLSET